ncbi:MAG: metal-dependent hydrolase [Phormidesmis sp.]
MPSPIFHSVSGYVFTRLPFVRVKVKEYSRPQLPGQRPNHQRSLALPVVVYSVVVANLPDLDFVPQIVTGIRFHRGPSHSLLLAFIISGLLSWIVHRYREQISYRAVFILTFGLYASHLLLDLFTSGGTGIPLLWPLSAQAFQSPLPLFPPVHHSRGLWDLSHLVFIGAEVVYSVFLLSGCKFFKKNTSQIYS